MIKKSSARKIRDRIEMFPQGSIFRVKDFLPIASESVTVRELSRLAKRGKIKRLSKGEYYVPRETRFGFLPPSDTQIIQNVIQQNGAYFAGTNVLNKVGVTTQVPNVVTVRGATSPRKLKVGKLTFNIQGRKNQGAQGAKTAMLTNIIETLKQIKSVPDGNIALTIKACKRMIEELPDKEISRFTKMVLKERPAIRALVGALLDTSENQKQTEKIEKSLNPLTTYKIGINEDVLPNKKKWKIK